MSKPSTSFREELTDGQKMLRAVLFLDKLDAWFDKHPERSFDLRPPEEKVRKPSE